MRVAPFINLLLAVCLLFSCQPGNSQVSANQPPELTPEMEELMKEWKGQAHRFEIDACVIKYNEKELSLASTLNDVESILGQQPDKREGFFYGWDDLGFGISATRIDNSVTTFVFFLSEGLLDQMSPNDQVIIVMGIPIKAGRLFGEFRENFSDGYEEISVQRNGYHLRQEKCDGGPQIIDFDNYIHYKTEHAGHFQLSKEYDPTTTSKINSIAIYKGENK